MAANTEVYTAQAGAPAVGQKVQVMQRTIDCSKLTGGLLTTQHLELFTMEPGDVVINGAVRILTVDAGGATIDLGIGGTGDTLASALVTSALATLPLDGTAATGLAFNAADTVDLSVNTATATTLKCAVSLVVLKGADFASE